MAGIVAAGIPAQFYELGEGGAVEDIFVTVSWSNADPLSVQFEFLAEDFSRVTWEVGRDLVAESLVNLAPKFGNGDVVLRVGSQSFGLQLTSPEGRGIVTMPRGPVDTLIAGSIRCIPLGSDMESQVVEHALDDRLAEILSDLPR